MDEMHRDRVRLVIFQNDPEPAIVNRLRDLVGQNVGETDTRVAASIADSAVLMFSLHTGRTAVTYLPLLEVKVHDKPDEMAENVTHMWSTRSCGVFGVPWAAK